MPAWSVALLKEPMAGNGNFTNQCGGFKHPNHSGTCRYNTAGAVYMDFIIVVTARIRVVRTCHNQRQLLSDKNEDLPE